MFVSASRETLSLGERERSEYGLLAAFLVTMILAAFPGKFLFYLTPFAAIMLTALSLPLISLTKFCGLVGFLGAISLISLSLHVLGGDAVNWWGIPVGLYTYSLALMAFSASGQGVSAAFYDKIRQICIGFILVQSAIGIVQFLISGDGDYVSGTYGLFDFLTHEKTISQVNYTFSLFVIIVFILQSAPTMISVATIFVGLAACAIAQSGHQTIIFLVTVVGLAGVMPAYRKTFLVFAVAAAILGSGVLVVYPQTLSVGVQWLDKIANAQHEPKREIVAAVADHLDSPLVLTFGLGLGQCCSRAAFLTQFSSSTVALPAFMVGSSTFFHDDVLGLVHEYDRYGENSAMATPFFSALAFPAEFGVITLLAGMAFVFREILANWRNHYHPRRALLSPGFFCNFFLIFFLLCCLIQDYLEFEQAICIPVLLYLIAKARMTEQSGPITPPPKFAKTTRKDDHDANNPMDIARGAACSLHACLRKFGPGTVVT